jgi:AraC family transcriptional regulator, transcriptional activator of pobA
MKARATSRQIPTYFLYGEAPRRLPGPLLHIESIEARSVRHHWKIDPHLHRVLHQMIFVLRGRGMVQTDSVRIQFRPPALMLIPAGSVHGFEFEPGTTGYVVSMSHQLLEDLARREPEVGALFTVPATLEFSARELRATDLARAFLMLARERERSLAGGALVL